MATISHDMRLFINGVDVSRSVARGGIYIYMPDGGVVTTELKLFALPEIIGNEIHLTLGGGASVTPTSTVPKSVRAFWLHK